MRTVGFGGRHLLAAITLVALAAGAAAARSGSPRDPGFFPNVPLVTQEGTTVRFYDDLLKGKVVLMNFIYTSCTDTCPLETARLAQVQSLLGDRMGKDIFFYSFTVDPTRDTAPVLKRYAEKFDVKPGWLFLTGKADDLARVRKRVGMAPRDGEDAVRDHLASVILGNEATGEWLRHNAFDNPKYLAAMIGDWLTNWKTARPRQSYAEMPKFAAPTRGEYLFRTRCAACHSFGKGDGVGPDLLGVALQRDRAWLARWLAVPDRMLAEGDPIATALFDKYKKVYMPNLRLNENDVAALIEHMESQDAAADPSRAGAASHRPTHVH
jgi:protein SCO1/2